MLGQTVRPENPPSTAIDHSLVEAVVVVALVVVVVVEGGVRDHDLQDAVHGMAVVGGAGKQGADDQDDDLVEGEEDSQDGDLVEVGEDSQGGQDA